MVEGAAGAISDSSSRSSRSGSGSEEGEPVESPATSVALDPATLAPSDPLEHKQRLSSAFDLHALRLCLDTTGTAVPASTLEEQEMQRLASLRSAPSGRVSTSLSGLSSVQHQICEVEANSLRRGAWTRVRMARAAVAVSSCSSAVRSIDAFAIPLFKTG